MSTKFSVPICVQHIDGDFTKSECERFIKEKFGKVARLLRIFIQRSHTDEYRRWEARLLIGSKTEADILKNCFDGFLLGCHKIMINYDESGCSGSPAYRSAFRMQDDNLSYMIDWCSAHCEREFFDLDTGIKLVNVNFPEFRSSIIQLVSLHANELPLRSLQSCYFSLTSNRLQTDLINGLHIEYLISCINELEIRRTATGAKIICFKRSDDFNQSIHSEDSGSVSYRSGPVPAELRSLAHEVGQILQNQPHNELNLHELRKVYNKTYGPGRTLCADDYGEESIKAVVERIENVCLLMGEGSRRVLTLQPNVQRRRFVVELTRLTSVQSEENDTILTIDKIQELFTAAKFTPQMFGMFTYQDLISLVSDNKELLRTFTVLSNVSLLRKGRIKLNDEQKELVRTFGFEVISLLRQFENCSIPFHQFIPLYHHSTRYQCKVEAFGVAKLEELFTAISHIVNVHEDKWGARYLQLTPQEMRLVLETNIETLISESTTLSLQEVEAAYERRFLVRMIQPALAGFNSVKEVIQSISPMIHLDNNNGYIYWNEELSYSVENTKFQLLRQLISSGNLNGIESVLAPLNMAVSNFVKKYLDKYTTRTEPYVMSPLGKFARRICILLSKTGNALAANAFDSSYYAAFNEPLIPQNFGALHFDRLIISIPEVMTVKKTNGHGYFLLKPEFIGLRVSPI